MQLHHRCNWGTMILITKQDCSKCDYVKSKIDLSKVRVVDSKSPVGLTEIIKHDIGHGQYPILINDGNVYRGAVNAIRGYNGKAPLDG